jgi:hypothetical protein
MARKTLSDIDVHAPPRAARYTHPDPELSGHYVRVQPSGAKAFCAVARNPSGKQIWTTIGATDVMPITQARVRAREVIQRVRDGLSAVEAKAETFAAVAANLAQASRRGQGPALQPRDQSVPQLPHSARVEGSGVRLDPQERRRRAAR